jgi:hypothetical protein
MSAPGRRRREQEQHGGRIEQQSHDDHKPPHGCFTVSTEQARQISNRAQISIDDSALTRDARLPHLQLGECLGLGCPLGNQLGADVALVARELHGRCGATLGGGVLDGRVNLHDSPIDVRNDSGLHGKPSIDVGNSARHRDVTLDPVAA